MDVILLLHNDHAKLRAYNISRELANHNISTITSRSDMKKNPLKRKGHARGRRILVPNGT
ncbi:hypothetical protein SDJN02_20557, partial [Cucurbita argyrosperma subsp. argyrosperma]